MDILWSPWRSKYIQSFKDETHKNESENRCIFCDALEQDGKDKEMLIVTRRDKCFVILNKYPYNGGHIMVAPNRHISSLEELEDDEIFALIKTIKKSIKVLEHISKPHGFNIGVNQGRVAGAGIPGHIHFHIVPRWNGDTSFMPVVSDTKIVSQSLEETQEIISKTFKELFPANE
ncbi:MAG: HIT domain-containing protein [Bacteroidetes bacterium]|nr:MAG: HIT domain-containing protein [Bacteroidota bacterium]